MSALDALQSCLAAEHADLFGYGVLGGVLAGISSANSLQAYADTCYLAHRSRRDQLTALLYRLGATPVAAEPAYSLPFRVSGVAACTRLARQLEARTAAVYALAVANTVESSRSLAIDGLTDCALRQVRWGSTPAAFPGIPDVSGS
jgi:hypothetical protein